ncbi:MAG: sulfatase-like hydrolase/transferase, partial [Verrucomicrobiota bacterium]|nr:sulfatase-like hydrolase/transferase [Verrucomicrobiota bacterium]
AEQGRPNILWITCEDTSPHLGCYGDAFARTPNLDALAQQGVRYTGAFAYTGVCAPSRSCLITGVYPLRLGSQHMRSTTRLPEEVKCFPEYLRAAGYYCSNNSKEDYNFTTPATVWDESSPKAHWRKRNPGQPFFSVFNFTVSHQSQIFCDEKRYEQNTRRLTPEQRHDPGKVTVPPFHPDTPEFRKEWARHYDNVTAMDYLAGDVLAELEKDGLAEETIVFFFSDHGTGMPGVKMFAWGPSLQVPLLIRFPTKWQHLAPAPAGGTTDRLVSFVDFAPTMLSLARLPIPEAIQGIAFLGEKSGTPRELIFGGKDRQGECADTIRTVRDARFQYNRNFHPELPFGQFMSYAWQHASMRAWEQLHREGKLSGPPARFFAPRKPIEELYDVQRDPWQVKNLAEDPAHAGELARLRAELAAQMKAAGDLGLLPEREMHSRAANATPWKTAADGRLNPIDELLRAADLANRAGVPDLDRLTALLQVKDSAVRWWGAIGLVSLNARAAPARAALENALADASPDVRVAAAEALANIGALDRTLAALEAALRDESVFVRLAALNVVQRLGARARPLLPTIKQARIMSAEHKDAAEYVARMVSYLPERIGGPVVEIAPGPVWKRHAIDHSSRGADGVKLGDVNGDGLPDIVTGWEEGGEVRLYLHPGPGRSREAWPRVTVGRVKSAEDAIFADLDGDGRLEVVSCTEGKTRSVFWHRFTGGKDDLLNPEKWNTAAFPVTAGAQSWMQAVALNVDGQHGTDLILASKGQGASISWLQSPAAPADLAAWQLHRLRKAGWIMSLHAHDMDGDGDADLFFTDRKGARSGVFWLENPGPQAARDHAPWKEHVIGAQGREVMFADLADVNGDGRRDVIVAAKPVEVMIFLDQSDGTWRQQSLDLSAGNLGDAKAVKAADLNADGLTDLLFTCENAGGEREGIVWLKQQKDASWKQRPLGGPDGVKYDLVQLLDLDHDGDLDVITCEERDQLGVVWYENPGLFP